MMLSDREAAALAAIDQFLSEHAYPPSFRDLQEALGMGSVSGTYKVLSRLRDKGVVEWESGRFRTIRRTTAST